MVYSEAMYSIAQPAAATSGWQIASTIASSTAVLVAILVTIINLINRAADRAEKRSDENARLLAQARLIVAEEIPFEVGYTDLDVNSYASQGRQFHSRRLSNHSGRPILDIHSEYWVKTTDGDYQHQRRYFPVILADQSKTMTIGVNEDRTLCAWRLRWKDADGRKWRKGLIEFDEPAPYDGEIPGHIPSKYSSGSD